MLIVSVKDPYRRLGCAMVVRCCFYIVCLVFGAVLFILSCEALESRDVIVLIVGDCVFESLKCVMLVACRSSDD